MYLKSPKPFSSALPPAEKLAENVESCPKLTLTSLVDAAQFPKAGNQVNPDVLAIVTNPPPPVALHKGFAPVAGS